MPTQNRPNLPDTDYHRIREYRLQGFTHVAIAKEVGCATHQVARYLRSLRKENKVPITVTNSQHLTILRFRESGLTSQFLAARLEIEADTLYRELAGYKSMSTRRMGLLKRLFEENKQEEKVPKKRGRPFGSRHD